MSQSNESLAGRTATHPPAAVEACPCAGSTDVFPIPEIEGDPWIGCLEPLLAEDRIKCDAWKDEVQNLLIFAGLFSAVVTAFVIQSYQSLQENPQDTAVALLAHIAKHLDNTSDTNIFVDRQMPPTSSSVRVNALWFTSLILSLTTVLVGIVSMQWMREYLRYPSNYSPKQTFAARNMRAEAFHDWGVPHIIAGLPVLLQIALVIFFSGLIDFLVHLNTSVAIPVIVLVVITLLFLLMTTALPTLQSIWTINILHSSNIPNQCPYKSPQAWAFLHLTTRKWIRTVLKFLFKCILLCMLFLSFWMLSVLDSMGFVSVPELSDWSEFDGLWLEQRQRLATKTTESSSPSEYRRAPGYCDVDCARGIACVVNGFSDTEDVALATCRSFKQLSEAAITEDIFALMSKRPPNSVTRAEIPQIFLLGGGMLPDALVNNENEMLLLERLPQTSRASPIHLFRKRQLELFIRITTFIFAGEDHLDFTHELEHPRRLFIPQSFRSVKDLELIPDAISFKFKEELLEVFSSYITTTINMEDREVRICHAEELLADFMQTVHTVTLSSINNSSTQENTSILSHLASVIICIEKHIIKLKPNQTRLLCYSAKTYLSRFKRTEWVPMARGAPDFASAFKSLIQTLRKYELRFGNCTFNSFHGIKYAVQWRSLVREVLSETNIALPLPSFAPCDTLETDEREESIQVVVQARTTIKSLSTMEVGSSNRGGGSGDSQKPSPTDFNTFSPGTISSYSTQRSKIPHTYRMV